MKLLDTCVWIEIILGSPLGVQFNRLLSDKQNVLISSVVQFELRRWALREYGAARANNIVLALREGVVVQTGERVAFLAADLARAHKLHALDALIYATALEHDAELVTCDAHFKDLPQVDYTAKIK
ncbi:MAG: type II toxin-antitoxin system VapC family toxin [Polaromonas sp.]|uniref:type II toxin-antitoxin system VapC family toxin n=1 Tax=Polaromonas sp. TaxID=1869339 RepID=UPI0027332194|nr:type II toxin-antitoxin system VapC family toxin [Polaromonas sp.]MDP2819131.1 type II toxin-antitoxin system VapC family toxin [Polaromonas sp.]